MKKPFTSALVLMTVLFISTGAWALDVYFTDTYYGGTVCDEAIIEGYLNKDVIGLEFNVDTLQATKDGTGKITVVLSGHYFTTQFAKGISLYANPGDLYINSKGWVVSSPDNNANTDKFDIATEGWDYVISYENSKIYNLVEGYTRTGSQGIWSTYREDQAYRGGYGTPLANAVTVTLDSTLGTLTFTVEGMGWEPDKIGYHWTMGCGNDVVEGVPEPGTMLLLGGGLIALGVIRRKLRN